MRMTSALAKLFLATGLLCAATGCDDDKPAPPAVIEAPGSEDCILSEPTAAAGLVPEGLLEGAEYYVCTWPQPATTRGARFGSFDFDDSVVSGFPVTFNASWEGTAGLEGRTVLLSGGKGFYAFQATSDDNPLSGTVHWHEDVVAGDRNMRLAVLAEDSDLARPQVGPTVVAPTYLAKVGPGEVQVLLHWSKKVDLDLYVIEPGGRLISSGTQSSPSGGMVDLDSYILCRFEGDRGRGNEHAFWPDGEAPRGEYEVSVRLYSSCAVKDPIPYRVSVLLDRTTLQVFDGVFDPVLDVSKRETVAVFRH